MGFGMNNHVKANLLYSMCFSKSDDKINSQAMSTQKGAMSKAIMESRPGSRGGHGSFQTNSIKPSHHLFCSLTATNSYICPLTVLSLLFLF